MNIIAYTKVEIINEVNYLEILNLHTVYSLKTVSTPFHLNLSKGKDSGPSRQPDELEVAPMAVMKYLGLASPCSGSK